MSPAIRILLAFLAVSLPAHAEDACYPRLRDAFDSAVKLVTQNCTSIKADLASDCQRSILDRCQKSLDELKRMQGALCRKFALSGLQLQGTSYPVSVDSQNTAQVANNALNQDNAAVSDSTAAKLSSESAKLSQLIKDNDAAIRAGICTRSGSYAVYNGRIKTLNEGLGIVRDGLDGLARRKKADSAIATSVATTSAQRSENLASKNTMLTPFTPEAELDEQKRPKWLVPLLVGAGGLAAVYALMKMKDGGPLSLPVDFGGDSSGSGGSIGSQKAPAYEGDVKQFTDKNGIKIDDAFSDADKRQIAAAISMVPQCHQKHLVGLHFKSNRALTWRGSSKCLSGHQPSTNPPIIELNPTCYGTVSAALAVHEMMHLLAWRTGMYDGYRDTHERHGECPVSPYSKQRNNGTNLHEDFAEAARIAIFPASGMAFNPTCATNKVRRAKELINACK